MTPERKAKCSPRRPVRLHRSREVRTCVERSRRRTLLLRALGLSALAICVSVVAAFVYCYKAAARVVDERLASGYLTSRAGLYAAPRVLRAGQNFPRERLLETLRRAGYVEDAASDVWNGAFAIKDDEVEIWPRRNAEHAAPAVVSVSFDRHGRIANLSSSDGPLAAFALEPETLTNDASVKTGRQTALTFAEIPPVLRDAILSIEDRRFFEHRGVDPTGLGRALLSWTGWHSEDELQRQGGSTITQQLVKNTYLTPERTLRRKFNEALIALALERRLSKQDIFALYCNEVYLGQRGGVAVRGVEQAARVYFDKDLSALTLNEAATIAGLIQSPARYAPDHHAEQARARRNVVLAAMLRDGVITGEQAQATSPQPVVVAPFADTTAVAPYFVDYVNRLVDEQLATRTDADARNLRIYTTLDLDLQQIAERAVAQQLERLSKIYKGKATPQAALVALDAQTGHVLAMVGGSSYAATQLNRVTDARRQPGSVFKPFVYATALESGISPATLILDAPRTFNYDQHAVYRPANYGDAYSQRPVTMRTGLVHSLNVVTVDLALRTGLERVAATAARFGLPKPQPYPALALGTTEATPLEIATAYTAFANNGARVDASIITRATESDGANLINELSPAIQQVVHPSTAYMITDALTSVIDEGTARAARSLQKQMAVAGKTGTSHDGWFAGYTPHLVCVVWVGFDDNTQLGLSGAASALPVWQEFMQQAVALRPELGGDAFLKPQGIMTVEIDPDSGLLATPDCPHRERMAVTPALAPIGSCFMHQPLLQAVAANNTPVSVRQIASATDEAAAITTSLPTDPAHDPTPAAPFTPTQIELNEQGKPRLTTDLSVSNYTRRP